MSYEIIEHTADLRLKVCGRSLPELFSEAVSGMMSILAQGVKRGPNITREVKVESANLTALLVDFLNEILTLCETNKEVYTEVVFGEFTETMLQAKLCGRSVRGFSEDIKAATYHEAKVSRNNKGEWETTLVFDI
jgi:SHS2 domain-containing protein